MGINFQNTPSLTEYINWYSSAQSLSDFNSAIIFSLEGGYALSEESEVALEVGYLLYSYTNNDILGQYEFVYNNIMPSLLYYYVLRGEGYQLKFGGGGGPRFNHVEETAPGTASAIKFNSTGYGLLIKADGNTLLGGNFYANIGVDMRYDVNGEPENDGVFFVNQSTDENMNLNTLAFGIHLGIAYIF
jgi:hypothetical protein